MSDSFHHHVPDTGTAGHHMHTDLGVTHHTSHSSTHHAATSGDDLALQDNSTPEYGSPQDITPPDRRTDRYNPRTMRTVSSGPLPAPIGVAFLVVFLVFFIAIAAVIALGAHAVFSDNSSPSTSVPDSGPALDQP